MLNKSFVPFLSNTAKLLSKTEETPGPGYYNIENSSENFIHKLYIKDIINDYKDSLYDFYSLINKFNLKNDKNPTPGPGEYNLSIHELFGGKIKKKKSFIKNLSSSLYNKKFLNNEKKNELKIQNKVDKNKSIDNNFENNNKNEFNLTKRVQSYTMKELFKSLILNNKKRNKNYEKNISFLKDLNYNNNSEINLKEDSFKKDFLKIKYLKLFDKSKIIKNSQICEKIKEINSKNKFKINTKIQENIFYLNEFINSKYFLQNPGPGYYFFDNIENKNKNKNKIKESSIPKTLNITTYNLIKNKNNLSQNDLSLQKVIIKNKTQKNIIKKSKRRYQLKSDIIKYKGKLKEIYTKNKNSINLNGITELLKLKENLCDNDMNNRKEIQEYEKPIKLNKTLDSENILNNFNSTEERFKGPFGYQNEIYKNDNPGPGQYEIFNYKYISKNNKNNIGNNLYNKYIKNSLNNTFSLKPKKFLIDEIKNEYPSEGSYNSYFYNTIEMKNMMLPKKLIYNPIRNGSFDIIKSMTERRVKNLKIQKEIIKSMLGPYSYFSAIDKKYKKFSNQSFNFGSNSKRDFKISDNSKIGPGYYNNNFNNNWIKKTYNSLFI